MPTLLLRLLGSTVGQYAVVGLILAMLMGTGFLGVKLYLAETERLSLKNQVTTLETQTANQALAIEAIRLNLDIIRAETEALAKARSPVYANQALQKSRGVTKNASKKDPFDFRLVIPDFGVQPNRESAKP